MKFFNWASGFFQDQHGSASSKRLAVYICLYYLFLLVKAATKGIAVNEQVLYTVGGIILFGIGAVTTEFFNKNNNLKPQ